MYKNAEKQKEASKEAMRRMRAKGITKGITSKGITVVDDVILEDGLRKAKARLDLHPDIIARIDAVASGPEDRARRIKGAKDYAQLFTNRPAYSDFAKRMAQAGPGHVQVSKPGDDDYVCSQTREKICWRCGQSTPSPLLATHYNCTIEACSEPYTAPILDARLPAPIDDGSRDTVIDPPWQPLEAT